MQKNIGIFLREKIPNIHSLLYSFQTELSKYGYSLLMQEGNCYGLEGVSLERIEKECELLLSLGGDGTLISTLRKIHSLPILGINAGRLGFLTGIGVSEFLSFIPKLASGDYKVEEHAMLGVYLNESLLSLCINEVLISKNTLSTMTQIEAKINQKAFNRYYCDGLIIATPTGSTAYNISAGGSVVYPYCKNILLTPLAPHSLTQRPMVVGDDMELEFEVFEESKIIIDGQKMLDFLPTQTLKVRRNQQSAQLIYPKERDYFEVLREKFHWGE